MNRHRYAHAAVALVLLVGGLAGVVATATPAAAVGLSLEWSRTISGQIVFSSPNVANLDGRPAVVVGDRTGRVLAYHLSDGSPVAGWPASLGVAVDSTPSVAPVGPGGRDVVYVGTGNASNSLHGGYWAINPDGGHRWFVAETNPPTDHWVHNGVQASLAVGTLQGTTAVVAPSLGQNEYALGASSGGMLPGFPWYQADSSFTTPALADVLGTGQSMIVEGGDMSNGISYGVTYHAGGKFRVLRPTGNYGGTRPSDGLVCQHDVDEVVQSSPAVGRLGASNVIGAVIGTGNHYMRTTTNHLLAFNAANCSLLWNHALDGATYSSPALADLFGNGQLHAVEGTNNHHGGGSVWAFDGATGATLWKHTLNASVIGGIATADVRGIGRQDVVVANTGGLDILDGKTGTPLISTIKGIAFQNTATVTRDPDGRIGITVAGYNAHAQGVIEHFVVDGSNGANVAGPGAWPMFHHDPQLTGNAGTPPPIMGIARKGTGYWLAQSNAGVFTCTSASCTGPTGVRTLNSVVVGIEATPDNLGYWTVAGDGGVFAAGDAPFKGSMGGKHLNKPIVGMARTGTGKGYWLVASDGGIFTFGDAPFKGSMGGKHLNAPIVDMEATPSGNGYWLVASDGGIFSFGDAPYLGSTGGKHLNRPIVGMARTPSGHGYWLVASDGGIFTFGTAGYHGSTGGMALSRPIVGIAVTSTGKGYWLATAAGKVYNFGDAAFHGSAR